MSVLSQQIIQKPRNCFSKNFLHYFLQFFKPQLRVRFWQSRPSAQVLALCQIYHIQDQLSDLPSPVWGKTSISDSLASDEVSQRQIERLLTPSNAVAVLEDPIYVSRLLSVFAQVPSSIQAGERYVRIMDHVRRLFEGLACARCHGSLSDAFLVDNVEKFADILKIHTLSCVGYLVKDENQTHHRLSADGTFGDFIRSFLLLLNALLNACCLFGVFATAHTGGIGGQQAPAVERVRSGGGERSVDGGAGASGPFFPFFERKRCQRPTAMSKSVLVRTLFLNGGSFILQLQHIVQTLIRHRGSSGEFRRLALRTAALLQLDVLDAVQDCLTSVLSGSPKSFQHAQEVGLCLHLLSGVTRETLVDSERVEAEAGVNTNGSPAKGAVPHNANDKKHVPVSLENVTITNSRTLGRPLTNNAGLLLNQAVAYLTHPSLTVQASAWRALEAVMLATAPATHPNPRSASMMIPPPPSEDRGALLAAPGCGQ